jgi:toxin ParE1/3/4
VKALNWLNGLFQAIETLHSFPERCAVVPESECVGQEIKHLIYGRYRVLFSIDKHTVYVLHIRHAAQKNLSKDDF